MPHRPLLVTHSGSCHLDDAFAYAVLRLVLGDEGAAEGHRLVRTRDEAVIAKADVVWDIGAIFDPTAGRFDHHQRGAPVRDDGLPYSAAGLVWRHHGEAAVRALLAPSGATELAEAIASEIDREVVRRIDEIDNGVGQPGDALGLASLVEDCNPTWDSPAGGGQEVEDAAFLLAADLADGFLQRRVAAVRARIAAEVLVLAAHAGSADPRILELGRKLPWKELVHAHGLPVLTAPPPSAAAPHQPQGRGRSGFRAGRVDVSSSGLLHKGQRTGVSSVPLAIDTLGRREDQTSHNFVRRTTQAGLNHSELGLVVACGSGVSLAPLLSWTFPP